ncbi:MAG: response regulator [candidate division KSB1 bacterium]|nr:response regulator [candidate division KSB1 bacterium]MDZ7302941.1 response regulator [candidate division KSB1 bacterium]MDZ7312217.1 response regulator [candidate division KSB1 bacterium]
MIPHAKGTILLIEDNINFQQNLAVVFRSAGYETLVAASAREGLTVLSNYSVHLIVLDYRLPDMDGMQFYEHLLTDEKYLEFRSIPVVAMTGFPITDEEKKRFLQSGAKAFITKATGFSELKKIVDREVEAYKAIINFDREAGNRFSLPDYLAYIEKQIIFRTIIRNPLASQEEIARELGIPRSTLSRKISEYQLQLR